MLQCIVRFECCMLQFERSLALCIHMDNKFNSFRTRSSNNKNNDKVDTHTPCLCVLSETTNRNDHRLNDARPKVMENVSQIAILYEWSNQVLNIRYSYDMYTLPVFNSAYNSLYTYVEFFVHKITWTNQSNACATPIIRPFICYSIRSLPWQPMSLINTTA